MKMLLALAAGALGYCYYCGVKSKATRASIDEQEHRWESEGGNVPAVATPSPVVQPQSSQAAPVASPTPFPSPVTPNAGPSADFPDSGVRH